MKFSKCLMFCFSHLIMTHWTQITRIKPNEMNLFKDRALEMSNFFFKIRVIRCRGLIGTFQNSSTFFEVFKTFRRLFHFFSFTFSFFSDLTFEIISRSRTLDVRHDYILGPTSPFLNSTIFLCFSMTFLRDYLILCFGFFGSLRALILWSVPVSKFLQFE